MTAEPGGAVEVEAGPRGLRITPISAWDWILSEAGAALSALWLIGFLIGGGVVIGQESLGVASLPVGLAVIVVGVIGGIPAIVWLATEFLFFLLTPVFIVLFPLLLLLFFPSVRRTLRGWGSRPRGGEGGDRVGLGSGRRRPDLRRPGRRRPPD